MLGSKEDTLESDIGYYGKVDLKLGHFLYESLNTLSLLFDGIEFYFCKHSFFPLFWFKPNCNHLL